jgi:hypothetical protein
VSFLTSRNVKEALDARQHRRGLISTINAISEYSTTFFRNPKKAQEELKSYAADLEKLKKAFAERTHFLPVLNHLFLDFPDDLGVESLEASAERGSISFGLVGSSKSVKKQQGIWRENEELDQLVSGIKQNKLEQRMVGENSVYFVQFECTLR